VGGHHTQRVLSLRGVRIAVTCDETCGITATSKLHVGHSKRVYRLRRVARQLAADRRVKFTLRASSRALHAVRRALRHHRRVTANVLVVGRDAAGNTRSARRAVRAHL
jgi:hypothetical protein